MYQHLVDIFSTEFGSFLEGPNLVETFLPNLFFFQMIVWRSLPIQLANCSLAAAVLSCAHACMKLD